MVALSGIRESLSRVALARPVLSTAGVTCFAVITVWVVFRPPFFDPDISLISQAPDYVPQVQSLLTGEGFGSFRYPPVFPLILAGISWASEVAGLDDAWLGGLLLLAFSVSGSALVYLLGERLWGSLGALLCVGAWLMYPLFWRLWRQPLSEAPFTVLLLLAVLLVLRTTDTGLTGFGNPLAAGVVLGLGMLVRPAGVGLPILFGLFILFRKGRQSARHTMGSAALLLAGAVLTVLPWEIYAWKSTGSVIPLSTGGVPTLLDGLTYAVDPSENRPVWVPEDVRSLQWDMYEKSYRELNSVTTITEYLLTGLRETPVAVVELFAIKAARSWYGTDSGIPDKWLLILQIPVVALLLVAVTKARRSRGHLADAGALILMIVLYFWVMTTAVLSIVRYMVPALALMVVTLPGLRMLPLAEKSKASD